MAEQEATQKAQDGTASSSTTDTRLSSTEKPHPKEETKAQHDGVPIDTPEPKSVRFWFILASLSFVVFATSTDIAILVTALPTIMNEINADSNDRAAYIWVSNVYMVTATVFLPLIGQISNIFGRRIPSIISIAIFALGAGISGGANSVSMLIAGRAVQGIGFGGVILLADILIADICPVRERAKYVGVVMIWAALGTMIGPLLGGVFVTKTTWRWSFYFNLPISGVAFIAMVILLRVKYERETTLRQAISRIDYIGNVVFIGSMTSLLYGICQAGTINPWSSAKTIVPIVVGAVGWIAFHIQQYFSTAEDKVIPTRLFTNRTSTVGFALAFLGQLIIQWVWMFLPPYFQAVQGASPLHSGVELLPYMAFMCPSAIVAGVFLSKVGRFRRIYIFGFGLLAVSCGLFSIMKRSTPKVEWAWFEIINAVGQGVLLSTVIPAIQGSLPESDVAASTSMYAFTRNFACVWGVTIPSTIFNNQFNANIDLITDANVRHTLGSGQAYSYASSGYVHGLEPGTRDEVIEVYVKAFRTVWLAAIAFAGLGFLLPFVMKHVELRTELETEYGLDKKGKEDEEKKLEDGEVDDDKVREKDA